MNKNLMKIIFSVLLVVVIVVSATYYYWTGTPEYSLLQIRKAVATQNKDLCFQYVNIDAIFENLWTDMKAEVMGNVDTSNGWETLGAAIGLQLVESMKPVLKQKLVTALDENWFAPIEAQKPTQPISKSKKTIAKQVSKQTKPAGGINDLLAHDVKIIHQGTTAYIQLPDKMKVVLTREKGEHHWGVTKIVGFRLNLD